MLRSIPLICGIIGLLSALSYYSWVNRAGSTKRDKKNAGTYSVNETKLIFEKEWMTLIIVIAVLCVAVGICINWVSAILFVFGCAVSILIEYLGIMMLSRGKFRFSSSEESDSFLFKIGIRTSAATGLFIASFGLLALGAIFIPFKLNTTIQSIACFGFGASTVVLFSESTFRKAGDLYESYIGSMISVIALSSIALNTSGLTSTFTLSTVAIYPLLIVGIGIVASSIGFMFVRGGEKGRLNTRINIAAYISAVIISAAAVYLSINLLQSYSYSIAIIIGLVSGLISGITSAKGSSFVPGFVFALSFVASYNFAGPYGVALTSVGFMSIISILIATQSYNLVSGVNSIVTKMSEGYSACASALTVLALFVAYTGVADLNSISITDPYVLACLLVGVMLPLICARLYTRSLATEINYDFIMKLLAIFVPGVIGVFLGPESLGGFLGGLITTGLIMSFVFSNMNSNQIDENSSNSISTSINTLIKYMTIFSLVFAPVFIKFGSFF